jgi:hypothetical protein
MREIYNRIKIKHRKITRIGEFNGEVVAVALLELSRTHVNKTGEVVKPLRLLDFELSGKRVTKQEVINELVGSAVLVETRFLTEKDYLATAEETDLSTVRRLKAQYADFRYKAETLKKLIGQHNYLKAIIHRMTHEEYYGFAS